MWVPVPNVHMRKKIAGKVQMKHSPQHSDHTEHQSHEKTSQIEGLPIHALAFLSAAFVAFESCTSCSYSGFKTCINRSNSSGVSKISFSNTRHLRESECLASASNAFLTSISLRKRSAPLTSQRSSLSSSFPASEISSVLKPSGSSTRYPGWTLRKFAH